MPPLISLQEQLIRVDYHALIILSMMLILSGSGGGIRTHDQLINSQLLYR